MTSSMLQTNNKTKYSIRDIFSEFEEIITVRDKKNILLAKIEDTKLFVDYPKLKKIPKDNGKMRDIYISHSVDNARQLIVYNYLYNKYNYLMNKNVVSYQQGLSTIKIMQDILYQIKNIKNKNHIKIVILDLTDYFNSTPIDLILQCKEKYLQGIKPEYSYYLEEFFKIDHYWYQGNLYYKKPSLQVGSAISAFFANLVLKEFDDSISNNSDVLLYRRYADDLILIVDETNVENVITKVSEDINNLGLKVNDTKTKVFNKEMFEWVGIQVNNLETLTLSEKHWKRRKHLIKAICKKFKVKISKVGKDDKKKEQLFEQMIRTINKWLYYMQENMSNATYIYRVNYKEAGDIYKFNGYIKDTIRQAYTGYHNKANFIECPDDKIYSAGYLDFSLMHKVYKSNKYIFHAILKKHLGYRYEIK